MRLRLNRFLHIAACHAQYHHCHDTFTRKQEKPFRMSNAQQKQICGLEWISVPAVCDTFSPATHQHVRHFQLLCNITEALKPHMSLLFASPFRPINDVAYELKKRPELMDPLLAMFSSPPSVSGEKIHPLCNPALMEVKGTLLLESYF